MNFQQPFERSTAIMILLLGLIIVICAVGLVLKYRDFIRNQNKSDVQYAKSLSGCASHSLIWIYFLGFFTVLFGNFFIAKTYKNFLSLYLLMTPLLITWGFAIFGILFAELIVPVPFIHFDNQKQRLFYLTFVNIILFFFILSIAILSLPDIKETIEGFLSGPDFTQGIVEEKSSSISRIGTNYYIDINDEHKHIPDSQWWFSLEKGDKIQYIHNPHANGISAIFQPNQINLTTSGLLLIVINSALWLLTILASGNGFIQSINKSKYSTIRV